MQPMANATASELRDDGPEVVLGTTLPSLESAGYEELKERRPAGLLRRYLATQRHVAGLWMGGLVDYVRTRPREARRVRT